MNWKPISELPELKSDGELQLSRNAKPLLLWVADVKQAATGSLAVWDAGHLGDMRRHCWQANGYHGDWTITHWCEIEPPKEGAE